MTRTLALDKEPKVWTSVGSYRSSFGYLTISSLLDAQSISIVRGTHKLLCVSFDLTMAEIRRRESYVVSTGNTIEDWNGELAYLETKGRALHADARINKSLERDILWLYVRPRHIFSFLILRRHSVSFYRMRYTMLSSNSNKVFDADDWLHLDRSDARRFPLRCALFKMGRFQKRNVGISFRNNPVRLHARRAERVSDALQISM